ncbi:MAG: sugar diacid recognition domain-containing protein [Pyramidobacter porci]|uniref:CdaR family transcriptional regulator n=1 Tax=Pyramidobacter porci TaxID=2605789 RepID=UPI002A764DE4|nr:sugar diacid recognition domain-containing protein [Pyramidobacter porci]MDY2648697.1 sugar diacid recognition domain-containing protein [Pyramidobacter porci]
MTKKYDSDERSLVQKYAQEIASSTAAIIGHNIIITDVDGKIIGASQSERIGQLHEASLEVARTGAASETTREQARQFRGTLPGVTFPIQNLNGRTVGTMALTGSPDEVRPFGLIVKKQIEILLRERELYVYSSSRESILQDLIHDLETFVPGVGNETMLQSRAIELGYDPSLFYIPIVVDLYQFGRYALEVRRECRDGESGQVEMRILNIKKAVLAEMRGIFSHPRTVSSVSGNNRFVTLHAVKDADHAAPQHEKAALAQVVELSQNLLDRLEDYGLKAAIGIGSPAHSVAALSLSCQEARKALMLGKKFKQRPDVYCIADFRMEDVISTIDAPVRIRFIKGLTGNLRGKSDWPELEKTIRAWCESGFSLVETARRLHIHRNTLIYRLEKIRHLTGEDIHSFRTCFNLYFALLLGQYSGPAAKESAVPPAEE